MDSELRFVTISVYLCKETYKAKLIRRESGRHLDVKSKCDSVQEGRRGRRIAVLIARVANASSNRGRISGDRDSLKSAIVSLRVSASLTRWAISRSEIGHENRNEQGWNDVRPPCYL
jgi:hypothetical protein